MTIYAIISDEAAPIGALLTPKIAVSTLIVGTFAVWIPT